MKPLLYKDLHASQQRQKVLILLYWSELQDCQKTKGTFICELKLERYVYLRNTCVILKDNWKSQILFERKVA